MNIIKKVTLYFRYLHHKHQTFYFDIFCLSNYNSSKYPQTTRVFKVCWCFHYLFLKKLWKHSFYCYKIRYSYVLTYLLLCDIVYFIVSLCIKIKLSLLFSSEQSEKVFSWFNGFTNMRSFFLSVSMYITGVAKRLAS